MGSLLTFICTFCPIRPSPKICYSLELAYASQLRSSHWAGVPRPNSHKLETVLLVLDSIRRRPEHEYLSGVPRPSGCSTCFEPPRCGSRSAGGIRSELPG